ncbi:MAG: hypothetical protein II336_15025 [Loktanella sp.]|nr:hypothetical protein [Loktanella sp.]
MLLRLPAAIGRAFLVVVLIVMPSALLSGGMEDAAHIIVLVALFAALFTFVEYVSVSPSLVEFRDAPPFNRMRFSALFAMVLCVSMIFRGYQIPSDMTGLFQASGEQIGQVIDFPYSPVRLLVLTILDDVNPELVALMRDAAGLSYLIALLSIVSFILLLRLRRWPLRGGAFNVWVNLPTFDPNAGGDVVERLQKDAKFNIILGFLLPFLVPAALMLLSYLGAPVNLASPLTLIWMVTAWAYLPASIVMRGVALSRVADMIAAQREKSRGFDATREWRLP